MILDLIREKLQQGRFPNRHLIQELEDHYLSLYEDQLRQGCSETEAKNILQNELAKLEIEKMSKEIFWIRNKDRISVISLACLFFTLFISFQFLDQIKEPPSIWPIAERNISSGFGEKMHPIHKKLQMHTGIDLRAAIGTEVVATAGGRIITSDYDRRKGHYIVIEHDSTYQTRYYHLSERLVETGQKISIGEVIGKVGSSGMSIGPHLHYEVIKDGVAVNPNEYLKA